MQTPLVQTLANARAAGRAWAEDRRNTGSTWSHFLLDDALSAVAEELPDEERLELAHEICATASAAWKGMRP